MDIQLLFDWYGFTLSETYHQSREIVPILMVFVFLQLYVKLASYGSFSRANVESNRLVHSDTHQYIVDGNTFRGESSNVMTLSSSSITIAHSLLNSYAAKQNKWIH